MQVAGCFFPLSHAVISKPRASKLLTSRLLAPCVRAACFVAALTTAVSAARAAPPASGGEPLPRTDSARPVDIIFDTDIGNDIDDVLALGLIHTLESRGECRLLAITITKDSPLAPPFTDAVNTFYGRGDIPIGMVQGGVTRDPGQYLPLAEVRDDGSLRYPHDAGPEAPDAVRLLRQTLASRPDGSVVLVQVGFFTNLARLLDTKPDDVSPLAGPDLVRAKVRLLSVMAGAFTSTKPQSEYNVVNDLPAARKLAAEWPGPMVWSGFEIGLAMPYPQASIDRDYRYAPHHPLPEAYALYVPPPHDRPSWDLTSVLAVVRPDRGYFGLSEPGMVTVNEQGISLFTPKANGRDRYLTATREQAIRCVELFTHLCSEPPHR